MDLIPDSVLQARFNMTSAQLGKGRSVTIVRAEGTPITGVLVYAKDWNPPPGCFRLNYAEAFVAAGASLLLLMCSTCLSLIV